MPLLHPAPLSSPCISALSAEFDPDFGWVCWYIEDEEYWSELERFWRDTVPGYREYRVPRGVIEDEL